MYSKFQKSFVSSFLIALTLTLAQVAIPQANAQNVRPVTITRLFWTDRDSSKLSYADLVTTSKWNLNRGWVTNFPALDDSTQSLTSISHVGGIVLAGVQRKSDTASSGWVAFEPGAFEEPHGNHNHWKYSRRPTVTQMKLEPGYFNPSSTTIFDNTFYLAGDTEPRFLKASPALLKARGSNNAVQTFSGGAGGPLAVVNNSVGYATWKNGEGDNAGRVDIVNLQNGGSVAGSFNLPASSINAATVNSAKVFFATADGIYWTPATANAAASATTASPVKLMNDQDGKSDEPLMTNSLANHRNWVIFTAGQGPTSRLCLINAASPTPWLVQLPIPVADGLSLTDPAIVLSLGKRYAFVFQDRVDASSTMQEQLSIVELDPNRDQDFSDAKIQFTMPVGASKVDGRSGHHSVCFDAYGRHAIITNPGDAVLTILALQDMKVKARFQVGGTPEGTIAIGAAEHFH